MTWKWILRRTNFLVKQSWSQHQHKHRSQKVWIFPPNSNRKQSLKVGIYFKLQMKFWFVVRDEKSVIFVNSFSLGFYFPALFVVFTQIGVLLLLRSIVFLIQFLLHRESNSPPNCRQKYPMQFNTSRSRRLRFRNIRSRVNRQWNKGPDYQFHWLRLRGVWRRKWWLFYWVSYWPLLY